MNILKKTLGIAFGALGFLFASSASAGMYDLSTGGTQVINSATFTSYPAQPTGTGNIDPFVRLAKNKFGTAEGYNTTVIGTYDNFGGATYNHEITVGGVGFIGTAGNEVMRFLLDIDQTKSSSLLSLDSVQIYISTVANQSVNIGSLASSALVYNMDAGDITNFVKLDYSLNNGSGSGDMTLDIPISMFNQAFTAYDLANGAYFGADTALKNGAFIYLYSHFGSEPGMEDNDGFEEWAHFQGNPIGEPPCDPAVEDCGPREIPEPNTLILISLGLLGSAIVIKRRRWTRHG